MNIENPSQEIISSIRPGTPETFFIASVITGVSIQSDIATQAAARILCTLKFPLS